MEPKQKKNRKKKPSQTGKKPSQTGKTKPNRFEWVLFEPVSVFFLI